MSTSAKQFFGVDNDRKSDILEVFGKNASDLNNDVRILKEWLKKQPQLPNITDDLLLENMLIKNKFRLEKAKLKLDKYYSIKNTYDDFFDQLDVKSKRLESMRIDGYFGCFPKLTANHERVYFFDIKPNFCDCHSLVAATLLLSEMRLYSDYALSDIYICNCANLNMKLIQNLTPALIHKVAQIFYEGFSGRISQIYYVNPPSIMELVLNIIRTFMPKKFIDRIVLIKDFKSLSKLISPEYIPKDFGGSGPTADDLSDKCWELLEQNHHEQQHWNKSRSNEKLRIGDPVVSTELYGSAGTFKKINID